MLLDTDRLHVPMSKKYLERILPMPNAPTSAQVVQLHPANPTLTLTPLLKPVSPSGQFNPTDNLTSDGRPKAQRTDPFRSYEDFHRVLQYFSKQSSRNAFLLVLGINTGLRISDMVPLKVGHFIAADSAGNPVFRDYIDIFEKKTGKGTKGVDDTIIITPAIKEYFNAWIEDYSMIMKKKGEMLDLDNYVFYSKQKQKKEFFIKNGKIEKNPFVGQNVLTTETACNLFEKAQDDLNIKYNLRSHTMRKTCLSLVFLFSKRLHNAPSSALEDTQLFARHSSQRVTARYLSFTRDRSAKLRNMLSDFTLGKSDITVIDPYECDEED
jgi:integrase